MEEPDEYIDFMAKYKEWIAIRRLGIRPGTTPQEIVYHMAGIRNTIDSKAYAVLGINTGVLDKFADDATSGVRKGSAGLAAVAAKIGDAAARQAAGDACADKKLEPLAEIYLLGKMITNLGYDTSINQSVMSKVFPELKPPKQLKTAGRKKKSGDAVE